MALKCRSPRQKLGAPSRYCRALRNSGFTLVEVLIALLILSVGLLGLQAVTLSAVRASALAEQNTRAATTATHFLEEAMEPLRRNVLPPSLSCALSTGYEVNRTVALLNVHVAHIEVRVTSPPRRTVAPPVLVQTHAYSNLGFSPSPEGTGVCP